MPAHGSSAQKNEKKNRLRAASPPSTMSLHKALVGFTPLLCLWRCGLEEAETSKKVKMPIYSFKKKTSSNFYS